MKFRVLSPGGFEHIVEFTGGKDILPGQNFFGAENIPPQLWRSIVNQHPLADGWLSEQLPPSMKGSS